MEKILVSMLIGLILTIPLGTGAFMVIRTAIAKNFSQALNVACACILVDVGWSAVALYTSSLADVFATTHSLFQSSVGIFLIIIGWSIIKFGEDRQQITFGRLLLGIIPNATVAVSAGFLFTHCIGPECFLAAKGMKFLMLFGLMAGELMGWIVILGFSTKFAKNFSIAALARGYGIITIIGGIAFLGKQFLN